MVKYLFAFGIQIDLNKKNKVQSSGSYHTIELWMCIRFSSPKFERKKKIPWASKISSHQDATSSSHAQWTPRKQCNAAATPEGSHLTFSMAFGPKDVARSFWGRPKKATKLHLSVVLSCFVFEHADLDDTLQAQMVSMVVFLVRSKKTALCSLHLVSSMSICLLPSGNPTWKQEIIQETMELNVCNFFPHLWIEQEKGPKDGSHLIPTTFLTRDQSTGCGLQW